MNAPMLGMTIAGKVAADPLHGCLDPVPVTGGV
jgi:hypothetical protein